MKIGIVGCGYWGKIIINNLLELGYNDLVLCDRKEVLDNINIDVDEIKDEKKIVIQDEIDEAKAELKGKMEEKFSDEGQKKIIQKINDAVDIPFLSEKMEEKIFTAIFNVIKGVLRKIF